MWRYYELITRILYLQQIYALKQLINLNFILKFSLFINNKSQKIQST